MAIRDLLYACVDCGREAGIKAVHDGDVCDRCGARYSRADGATIRVVHNDGSSDVKHPSEWLDLLEQRVPIEGMRPDRRERVFVRTAVSSKPLYHRGIYLGQVEHFGDPEPGWLSLKPAELCFEPDNGAPRTWPLDDLTAVQPSSTSLQLKLRRGPVLSLKFPEASSLLWEEHVRHAVQSLYSQVGRGQIREYQPRIVCR
jgi:hypothetical protein